MVDAATQTDPITILDSAVQSSSTNTNSQTEYLQKQKGKTNTTNKNQTKTPTEEKKGEAGLKKSHHRDDKKRLERNNNRKKDKQEVNHLHLRNNKQNQNLVKEHKDQAHQTENEKVQIIYFNNMIGSDH